jgi:hypothetical protein
MILVTHTNGPFDGQEICIDSKVIIGQHQNADIDLAFDPKVSGWVVIEKTSQGVLITVKGEIEADNQPLSDVRRHRIERNGFNLKIGQSTFSIHRR